MIEASALCAHFEEAYANGWGYIYGTAGVVWTASRQSALQAKYAADPAGNSNLRYSATYGSKWIGKHVADCSGLFAWAFRELGGSIYHGSNTIWRKYTTRTGTIREGVALRPGTAVFLHNGAKRTHIGLYVGGDSVIEAKGTKAGVVMSSLSDWDEWGELRGVHYDGDEEVIPMGTLRRGSRGDEVSELQEMLSALGYDCGKADGVYGAKTEAAVRAFQQAEGLAVDGIAGQMTRTALQAAWDEMQVGGHPTAEQQAEELAGLIEPLEEMDSKVVITMSGKLYRALREVLDAAIETDGR